MGKKYLSNLYAESFAKKRVRVLEVNTCILQNTFIRTSVCKILSALLPDFAANLFSIYRTG
jgi:hypothetical protein